MHTIRTFVLIACFIGKPAFSQEAPRFEIFGGYSFAEETNAPYGGHSATNGWQTALKFNLTPRIGLVAEANGQYGTPRYTAPQEFGNSVVLAGPSFMEFGNIVVLPDTSFSTHTFLFGPEVNAYRRGRVSINLRVLAGFGRQGNPGGTQVTLGASSGPQVLRFSGPVNYGFSAAAGGNVDIRLKGGLSWRVVQPEVLVTRFDRAWKPDFRAATGLVFSFGKR